MGELENKKEEGEGGRRDETASNASPSRPLERKALTSRCLHSVAVAVAAQSTCKRLQVRFFSIQSPHLVVAPLSPTAPRLDPSTFARKILNERTNRRWTIKYTQSWMADLRQVTWCAALRSPLSLLSLGICWFRLWVVKKGN